jgi:hypothetical protein
MLAHQPVAMILRIFWSIIYNIFKQNYYLINYGIYLISCTADFQVSLLFPELRRYMILIRNYMEIFAAAAIVTFWLSSNPMIKSNR